MFELKNTLENKILKMLSIHTALGQIKLFEMTKTSDSKDEYVEFNRALFTLEDKGMIDIVMDKSESMKVIRVKQILH